jgi:hypothetical protein
VRALISEREAGAGAINDTIVPRLAAAGALPSRVALPPGHENHLPPPSRMKPRFGAIVQLLLQPMLCVGAATHLGSGCSPVRPSVGGSVSSRARGPLPEQRCEKETAAGKEADAQPRRVGHRHCDTAQQD